MLIQGTDYRKAVEQRKFVILLGDGLGDVTMAEGVDLRLMCCDLDNAFEHDSRCVGIPHEVVLKVGFLNDKVEELMPLYREVYDVIITNDGSMDVVVELLSDMCARVEVA
eukprot:7889439-Pyramimonas_sp.AAC.1